MKKIIYTLAILLAVSSCNNAPKMSESATKVVDMQKWVDSVKAIVDTTTIFDSAVWADRNAQFQNAVAGISEQDLDETTKTTFNAVKEAFIGVMATAQKGVEMTKAKAMEMANKADSTVSATPNPMEKIKEVGEKVEQKVDAGSQKVNKALGK